MAFFRKKSDPMTQRSRTLKAEIAALETEIQHLNAKSSGNSPQPRLRSTALPDGPTIALPPPANPPVPNSSREPIFESMDHPSMAAPADTETTPAHFNELGVRKYDLAAGWQRLRNHFRGPAATNPKLVSYLAAGSIRGLRPLRYEKRVARNRFLFLFVVLVLVLWGVIAVFLRNR